MPDRNVEGDYRYAYQGQEKDAETGKEAFQLRLWDSRIGRWLTTDPYGQYQSPYMGMGNNPINGVDSDGGYVYIIGGDFSNKKALLEVLGTVIGKERLEYLINSPHFHLHIGLSPGLFTDLDGTTSRHGAATIGGNGIFSPVDSFLTEEDIASKHGARIASELSVFLIGARKDRGINFYVGMRLKGPTIFGAGYDLFHEVDAHVFDRLFRGVEDGTQQHLNHAGTENGRPDFYNFGVNYLDLPAFEFLNQQRYSDPSTLYYFGASDSQGNQQVKMIHPRHF